MGIDPFLYVAFGAGFALGRVPHRASPWVGRATFASVCGLIFFLGAELGAIPGFDPFLDVPPALLFVTLIVGLTLLISVLLPRGPEPAERSIAEPQRPAPVWMVFIAALVLGFLAGRSVPLPAGTLLTGSLYLLLALVAYDLRLSRRGLYRLWAPLTAAVGGATLAAILFGLIDPIGWVGVFATAYGFGWYSLAGPLVTARLGASMGLLAFLTNFLREDLTIILAPTLGPKVRAEGLVAMGGATSMDTSLYSAVRYGEPRGDPATGTLALSSGLTLTVAASLLLPLLLSFG